MFLSMVKAHFGFWRKYIVQSSNACLSDENTVFGEDKGITYICPNVGHVVQNVRLIED